MSRGVDDLMLMLYADAVTPSSKGRPWLENVLFKWTFAVRGDGHISYFHL